MSRAAASSASRGRSLLLIGALLLPLLSLAAGSSAPVAARAPVDPAQLALQYSEGDWRTTTPDGQWWDPDVGGSWRISRARYDADGRMRLRVVVRPFAGSLGLDPGPAVLFGTLELVGGGGGDTGAIADVKAVARANVRPCRAGPSCVYRATITLPTDRIAAAAAGRPGFATWTHVNVRLTLVRTFSQGAWVQVIPGPYPRVSGGTVAAPHTAESRTEVYGLFTPAQGERWLGWRGPGDSRPVPILRIVEQARRQAGDRSEPVSQVPVRLDIDPGDCSGWTLMTATGDVAYDDVRRDVGRTRTGVAVPPGTTWYIRAPSLENTSWPSDTVHSFGPFVAPDEPFALSGAFSCRRLSGDVTMSTGPGIPDDAEPLGCLPSRSPDGGPCPS